MLMRPARSTPIVSRTVAVWPGESSFTAHRTGNNVQVPSTDVARTDTPRGDPTINVASLTSFGPRFWMVTVRLSVLPTTTRETGGNGATARSATRGTTVNGILTPDSS